MGEKPQLLKPRMEEGLAHAREQRVGAREKIEDTELEVAGRTSRRRAAVAIVVFFFVGRSRQKPRKKELARSYPGAGCGRRLRLLLVVTNETGLGVAACGVGGTNPSEGKTHEQRVKLCGEGGADRGGREALGLISSDLWKLSTHQIKICPNNTHNINQPQRTTTTTEQENKNRPVSHTGLCGPNV